MHGNMNVKREYDFNDEFNNLMCIIIIIIIFIVLKK
jgi:hypothetical protein